MKELVALCGALLLVQSLDHVIGHTEIDEWEKFKADYGKVYTGTEDDKR